MSSNAILVLLGWLLGVIVFLGCIVLLRYLQYREHMALIKQGFHPGLHKQKRNRGLLRAGLITMMVGVSLTVGLYPIGFLLPIDFPATPFHLGPWLLPGLIPLGVGLALTISYYLEPNLPPPADEASNPSNDSRVISLDDHRDREKDMREKSE